MGSIPMTAYRMFLKVSTGSKMADHTERCRRLVPTSAQNIQTGISATKTAERWVLSHKSVDKNITTGLFITILAK